MPRSHRYSTSMRKKQSTGLRPLIAFCVISLLVLTFYLREGDAGIIHSVRGVVQTVATPFRVAGSAITSPFRAVGNVAQNLTASPETLRDLKTQNEELTAQLAQLSEAQADAERLQGLLDLQSSAHLDSKAARIIGTSSDSWSRTVTIDKGSADGVTVNMPVANSGGIIGQVTEVSANSSTVRLITDESSSVSAMVQSTRAQGMLEGQPDGTLRLAYVDADAQVEVGDLVVTSGLGGVYPKGLMLGRVASVEKSDNALYYTIVVTPASEIESNEEVLVILSLSADQRATAEDVAAAESNPEGGAPAQDEASTQGDGADDGSSGDATDASSDQDASEGGE